MTDTRQALELIVAALDKGFAVVTASKEHKLARAALSAQPVAGSVPKPSFECASQYATKRKLAVTRDWIRGWDACTDYVEEVLAAPQAQAAPAPEPSVFERIKKHSGSGKCEVCKTDNCILTGLK